MVSDIIIKGANIHKIFDLIWLYIVCFLNPKKSFNCLID